MARDRESCTSAELSKQFIYVCKTSNEGLRSEDALTASSTAGAMLHLKFSSQSEVTKG